jgi:hypothetical protein
MKNGKKIKISMDFSKYVKEDLDNDLEAIFVDMMDEGFEIKKDVSLITRMFDLRITRRTPTGLSFAIKPYKDHIKQLFDISERRGIELFQGFIYIDNSQKPLKDVTSLLTSDGIPPESRTDFRGKTWEEIWDALTFTIYCSSEKDSITNFTMTFCEK